MTRIGLISDTHSYLDDKIFSTFKACDEIWHAGDFGTMEIADRLQAFKPVKGVYGNIDGVDVKQRYPEMLRWNCEEVEICMIHIGGYPGKYVPAVKNLLTKDPPKLFICGHSHILKVIFDKKWQCLHMNPGAAGKQGWHKIRTVIRFAIDEKHITDCEVVELGKR